MYLLVSEKEGNKKEGKHGKDARQKEVKVGRAILGT